MGRRAGVSRRCQWAQLVAKLGQCRSRGVRVAGDVQWETLCGKPCVGNSGEISISWIMGGKGLSLRSSGATRVSHGSRNSHAIGNSSILKTIAFLFSVHFCNLKK